MTWESVQILTIGFQMAEKKLVNICFG